MAMHEPFRDPEIPPFPTGSPTCRAGSRSRRRSACSTSTRRRSTGWAWRRSAPAPRPCTAWPGSAPPRCSRRPSGWPPPGTRSCCAASARPPPTRCWPSTTRTRRAPGATCGPPVVNPLRDPRWGRNEEGYSEDPWLTGLLAAAYAWGLRGSDPNVLKTAPTLKHFLAYNNETDRCVTSSNVPPRVLHEYELPAFRPAIEQGAAVAVMPSYNLVNG
ncbi:glycoside hydrolase family 3 N-terminal domain-containing protein [Nonomuraea ferruginea]